MSVAKGCVYSFTIVSCSASTVPITLGAKIVDELVKGGRKEGWKKFKKEKRIERKKK